MSSTDQIAPPPQADERGLPYGVIATVTLIAALVTLFAAMWIFGSDPSAAVTAVELGIAALVMLLTMAGFEALSHYRWTRVHRDDQHQQAAAAAAAEQRHLKDVERQEELERARDQRDAALRADFAAFASNVETMLRQALGGRPAEREIRSRLARLEAALPAEPTEESRRPARDRYRRGGRSRGARRDPDAPADPALTDPISMEIQRGEGELRGYLRAQYDRRDGQ